MMYFKDGTIKITLTQQSGTYFVNRESDIAELSRLRNGINLLATTDRKKATRYFLTVIETYL